MSWLRPCCQRLQFSIALCSVRWQACHGYRQKFQNPNMHKLCCRKNITEFPTLRLTKRNVPFCVKSLSDKFFQLTMAIANSSQLRICHLKAQPIELYFAETCKLMQDHRFHIIAFTESRLKPNQSSKFFDISGYTFLRVDRLGVRSGGVVLYVDTSINCKEICRSEESVRLSKLPEYLFVSLQVGSFKILFGVIYGPHEGGYWSEIEDAPIRFNALSGYTILVGDFNIDWWKMDYNRKMLSSSLNAVNLEPLPFQPTNHRKHLDTYTHTTMDYVCVSDSSKVTSTSQIHCPSISTHDAIYASFEFQRSFHHFDTSVSKRFGKHLLACHRTYDKYSRQS